MANDTVNGFLTLLIIPLGVWLAFVTLVYFYQPNLLYFPDIPTRQIQATPATLGIGYEPVTLDTEDGIRLGAWYLDNPTGRGTVLFCHGNAGNISHRLESLRQLHGLGFSVLIFDYRGYGHSGGRPSEEGTYKDAEAAWHYLTVTQGIQPRRIVVFGRSLGGAVAARLATRHPPGAVVIESTFTSVPDIAGDLYPWLPVKWLSRYRYDVKSSVSATSVPILVIHSRDDEIIPFKHGQQLYAHANPPRQFLEIRGGHNDGFLTSGKLYINGLDTFLKTQFPYATPD